MYTCPDGQTATLKQYANAKCFGPPTSSVQIMLNTCKQSLGTSYAATSFTCPNVLDTNNGLVYQLKYDELASNCGGSPIEYNAALPYTCISTDLQTSQKYLCASNNSDVAVYRFSDLNCINFTGYNNYPEICQAIANPYNDTISGYYTQPSCRYFDPMTVPTTTPTMRPEQPTLVPTLTPSFAPMALPTVSPSAVRCNSIFRVSCVYEYSSCRFYLLILFLFFFLFFLITTLNIFNLVSALDSDYCTHCSVKVCTFTEDRCAANIYAWDLVLYFSL
jgi:hypothetical protein